MFPENCILFKKMPQEIIGQIYTDAKTFIKDYSKFQYIAMEGDALNAIGIILSGQLAVQKIYPSGKTLTLKQMSQGNVFGEAIIFSQKSEFPSSFFCLQDTKVLYISREILIQLIKSYDQLMLNFMSLLSNRILMLSEITKTLSMDTIRKKLANYLLSEYMLQKNTSLKLALSKERLAEKFGVTRPSLSREFQYLKNNGIIDYDKSIVHILDMDALEDLIYE